MPPAQWAKNMSIGDTRWALQETENKKYQLEQLIEKLKRDLEVANRELRGAGGGRAKHRCASGAT